MSATAAPVGPTTIGVPLRIDGLAAFHGEQSATEHAIPRKICPRMRAVFETAA